MERQELAGLTGGEVVRETLVNHGVDHVFGYPGGAVLPLFDGIFKSTLFRFILSHHEQGAGHMAEGYARASGKPGVVLVTSGPGSSNVITPMYDALLDGTPMVVICGQVSTAVEGTGAFQEIDVVALAKNCSKWCTCVRRISDLPDSLETAFYHATHGRPGPVLLAVPKDVGLTKFDAEAQCTSFNIPIQDERAVKLLQALTPPPSPPFLGSIVDLHEQIDHAASMINQSERPVIIAGNGVSTSKNGPALLARIANRAHLTVATTLLGLGSYDEMRENALHMVGTYGTPYANYAVQNADLILALGARLDERAVGKPSDFAPEARKKALSGLPGGIVHFDISPQAVGKAVNPVEVITGDLTETLPILLSRLKTNPTRAAWLDQIQLWKTQYPSTIPTRKSPRTSRCLPQQVVKELDLQTLATKHTTTITTGVGQHQMWAARFYRYRHPRSLITSGSLGTMGFGLPSAIGAQIACPNHTVIDLDGDASFCMTMEELLTASQQAIPVKIIIFNNEHQGMIKQLQQADYGGRVCHTRQGNPDMVKLARSMNCQARRCACLADLPGSIYWLLRTPGPALLDVLTDEVEMVPVVPQGRALDQIKLV